MTAMTEIAKHAARGAYDQVQVIRSEVESKELDTVPTDGASEYATQDLVRLRGRTQEQTALQATNGGEVNGRRIEDSKWSAHEVDPPHPPPSMNHATPSEEPSKVPGTFETSEISLTRRSESLREPRPPHRASSCGEPAPAHTG